MIPGREYSVTSVLRLLWRWKWLPVTGALLGAAAGAASVWKVPNLYRASATIIVQPQLIPQTFVKSTVTQTLEEQLRGMGQRILASDGLAPIVSQLNPYRNTDAQTAMRQVRASVSVDVVRADAFRVSFVHRDRVMAARVAQRVAQAFVEENTRNRVALAEETDQFMASQLESTRAQLAEQEQKLEQYRRTYAGQLPTQMSSNLQAIQNAQTQLRAVDESIQQDRDRKLRIEQTIATLNTGAGNAPAEPEPKADAPKPDDAPVDPFTEQVWQLRGQDALRQLPRVRRTLQGLELQLKPDHPDIIRLQRVIAELERRVREDLGPDALSGNNAKGATAQAEVVQRQRTRSIDQLRAEAAAIDQRLPKREAEEAQLVETVKTYQQHIDQIPTREAELTSLTRDYDTLRESYLGLLAKKQEADLASELERRKAGESFRIVESASVPNRPFSPNRRAMVGGGSAGGLLLALLIIGWSEYRDENIRTESEVAKGLGIRVLAFVPVVAMPGRENESRLRRRLALAVSTTVLVLTAVAFLYLRAVGRL